MTDIESVQAPAALRALKQWVIWRMEDNPDGPKPRKMPYYAWSGKRRGKQNTEDDIRQLVGFSEAKAAAAKKGAEWGVGMAMIKGSPVTALDFDRCVTQNDRGDFIVKPEVDSMVVGTYAEISPSGTGIRAFVSGSVGNNRQAHHEDWDYGLELFNGTGFVTFTGNITDTTKLTGDENTVAKPTAHLLEHIAVRFGPSAAKEKAVQQDDGVFTIAPPRVGMSIDDLREMLTNLNPNMSNKEWHDLGAALHHETYGSPEGCALWDEWSAEGNDYPGTQYFENRWEGFDSEHPNAIRVVSYFKAAQEGATTQGKTWNIPRTAPPMEPMPEVGYHGFFSVAEFEGQAAKVDWFVKGFLPRAQLAILFGPSGSGKSFLAFDLCAAIARGLETWNGKRVMKARVAYLVAEGVPGFRQRIKAYRAEHGVSASDLDMTIIAGVVPNLTDAESVKRLKADLEKFGPYDLIVFDTFAQVTSGANENSGEAMGTALKHCREIAQVCGAMSLLVHHSGKDDTKGARGWSGLKAAADVELEVKRDKDGEQRSVTITKMKDGEDNAAQGFKLRSVSMGKDEDGDDITSCVVEYNDAGQVSKAQKLGHNQATLMRALADLQGFNSGEGIEEEKLIAATVEMLHLKEGAKQDMRPTRAKEALNALIGSKCVFVENGLVSAAKADE